MLYLELARRNRRWTQAQLSEVTRISQPFISQIELGKAHPTPDQIHRLAVALNLLPALVTQPVAAASTFDDETTTEAGR